MTSKIARFDGREVWHTLSAKQKADIGAAALECIAAGVAATRTQPKNPANGSNPILYRAAKAAGKVTVDMLDHAVAVTVPKIFSNPDEVAIPAMVGPICTGCGCTELDACKGGCSWVRSGWCSACEAGRNRLQSKYRRGRKLQ